MSLGGGSRASRPWPRRGLLLLGLLLLPVVVSVASGENKARRGGSGGGTGGSPQDLVKGLLSVQALCPALPRALPHLANNTSF